MSYNWWICYNRVYVPRPRASWHRSFLFFFSPLVSSCHKLSGHIKAHLRVCANKVNKKSGKLARYLILRIHFRKIKLCIRDIWIWVVKTVSLYKVIYVKEMVTDITSLRNITKMEKKVSTEASLTFSGKIYTEFSWIDLTFYFS